VRLAGVRGHPRPATLKALAYFDGGWLGEGEISYAGVQAEARAKPLDRSTIEAIDMLHRANGKDPDPFRRLRP